MYTLEASCREIFTCNSVKMCGVCLCSNRGLSVKVYHNKGSVAHPTQIVLPLLMGFSPLHCYIEKVLGGLL